LVPIRKTKKEWHLLRGIAVVDAGKTNTKVILFDGAGKPLATRTVASLNHEGPPYRTIDPAPLIGLCRTALAELDAILPIDVVVPCAHGAALACLAADGSLALPVMDYTSEPPAQIVADYKLVEPPFEEVFGPLLPMALTHALQLYWQAKAYPTEFARVETVVPWIQYVAYLLSGKLVTEISSMSCQSQLMNVQNNTLSSLVYGQGWDRFFPPFAKAWDVIGELKAEFRSAGFRGRGHVLAGVHDSNANYLRYLAGGQTKFTLLSTGTWIIGFDTEAKVETLNRAKDMVSNTDVFGKLVACCRFFGGREFEVLGEGASGDVASLAAVQRLIDQETMALPSFSDGGGPVPHVGGKGRITGPKTVNPEEKAALASLYCALMVAESLDAIGSRHDVIVDGPFSKNRIFLQVLAALRKGQKVLASDLRDGTTAGAACLGLMPDGMLPHIDLSLAHVAPADIAGIENYRTSWQKLAYRHGD
jgi:sugar (pentulose or hexulose) kinase